MSSPNMFIERIGDVIHKLSVIWVPNGLVIVYIFLSELAMKEMGSYIQLLVLNLGRQTP